MSEELDLKEGGRQPAPSCVVRRLQELEEYFTCEVVQRRIWGFRDVGVTAAPLLLTTQRNGGLVLGAFVDGQMVGMLYGFLGREERPEGLLYKHCSHMMGVVPEWQERDIGYRLKLAQREWVLAQGLELVTWTFDPLEGVNAALNFAKLGVVSRAYLPNLYGDMRDELNVGLPTDRFQVEWWIRSPRVVGRLEGRPGPHLRALLEEGVPCITRSSLGGVPLTPGAAPQTEADLVALRLEGFDLGRGEERLLVEVHPLLRLARRRDLENARAWREGSGHIFQHYFRRGYWAVELLSQAQDGARRNFYLLQRDFEPRR